MTTTDPELCLLAFTTACTLTATAFDEFAALVEKLPLPASSPADYRAGADGMKRAIAAETRELARQWRQKIEEITPPL